MIYSFHYPEAFPQSLPVFPLLLGINHRQEPIQRPKGFPFYQWFYCVKGTGELIVNQQKSILHEGQGALIYPKVPHSYRGLTSDWTVHFIGFSGPNCPELLKTLEMHESDVYHFSDETIFPEYVERLHDLQKQKRKNKYTELSKECYSFLLDLSSCVRRINASVPAQENRFIRKIMDYMEENYQDPISLDDLAEHVQLSKEYMCTIFKKSMRQTIMQALLTVRISRARLFLIQYPEKKVQEIARMCGFESPSYFGKVFKKEVGVTPENYRNRIY